MPRHVVQPNALGVGGGLMFSANQGAELVEVTAVVVGEQDEAAGEANFSA
jgi:hypothetical protein